MSDFFLALNRPIYVDIFGIESLEIHQIIIKDLEDWLIVTPPIKEFLQGKKYSDEVLRELLLLYKPYVVGMCALVTNFNQIELSKFLDDESEFIRLVRQVLIANQAYFADEELNVSDKSHKDMTWFDAFQSLIRYGHTHSEILKLSYGAFLAYLKAAKKAYRNELAMQINMLRLAQYNHRKKSLKNIRNLKITD